MVVGNSSDNSTAMRKPIDNIKRTVVCILVFVSIATILVFTPLNKKNNAISQISPILTESVSKTSQSHHTHVLNQSHSLVIVACVGDSITKGSGATNVSSSYPSLLQRKLGKRFHVGNYGVGGASASRISDLPYWTTALYNASLKSKPHIVILQLATNDAKNTTWNERLFEHDYIEMVNSYITLPSKPKVFISIPPPYYSNISLWHIRGDTINKKIPLILKSILKKINTEIIQNQHIFPVELIDNFEALGGSELKKTELFLDFSKKILYKTSTNDGCHPNNLGYEVMANNVHNALKNTTFKGHLSHLNLLLDSKI